MIPSMLFEKFSACERCWKSIDLEQLRREISDSQISTLLAFWGLATDAAKYRRLPPTATTDWAKDPHPIYAPPMKAGAS